MRGELWEHCLLRKSPVLPAAAVVCMALGVLRPLPYKNPEQLVRI